MADTKSKMTLLISECDKVAMEEFMRQMGIEFQIEERAGEASQEPQERMDMQAAPIPVNERDTVGTCQYCFLHPCIAERNKIAHWLGMGRGPSTSNSPIRKRIYYKFWSQMDKCGGWNLPQYLQKKQSLGGGEHVVWHHRQIMPNCVLKLVRNLYPNRKDEPYMGHKW